MASGGQAMSVDAGAVMKSVRPPERYRALNVLQPLKPVARFDSNSMSAYWFSGTSVSVPALSYERRIHFVPWSSPPVPGPAEQAATSAMSPTRAAIDRMRSGPPPGRRRLGAPGRNEQCEEPEEVAEAADEERAEHRQGDRVRADRERLKHVERLARREVDPPDHPGNQRVDDPHPTHDDEEGADGRQPSRVALDVHVLDPPRA